jgi:hypothetical protein
LCYVLYSQVVTIKKFSVMNRLWVLWMMVCSPLCAREWPKDLEEGFQQRSQMVIGATTRVKGYGNTFFENEKRAYGWAMLSILGGEAQPALKFLQEEDNKAKDWNAVTLGIDYFPAFTLKHQIRKYFHFGDRLDPAYRERMRQAAILFTEKDPYRRPHPAFKPGTQGWTPEARNSWVDIRNTDNLKLMRETSVYLLAEEAQNEETRLIYKNHLSRFVEGLYRVGMSEWDSENYLGHSIAPLVNLHDFSKDPEVKALAKAALDWIAVTGALKYRQGIWGGPNKRDYNHPEVFGGSAAVLFWLWFGNAKDAPPHYESDEIHLITSSYRPPLAAVRLAKKDFANGLVQYSCKPGLESWNTFEKESPAYRETLYFDDGYQLGTLWRGTQNPDVNGFKILLENPAGAPAAIVAAPCSDSARLGSPVYQHGILADGSAVGQNRNLSVYLTAEAPQPYLFWMPTGSKVIAKNEKATVAHWGNHAVAFWPINLSVPALSVELTEKARQHGKETRWAGVEVWEGKREGKGHYGFVIEVVKASDDAAAKRFADAALKLAPDVSELAERAAVTMTGTNQQRLRLQWGANASAIQVWADGKPSPFNDSMTAFVYRGDLLNQDWRGGKLEVSKSGKLESGTFVLPGR